MVVVVGFTVIVEVTAPVFQTKVVPAILPETVRVADDPLQIDVALLFNVSTGFGNTLIITDPVETHP